MSILDSHFLISNNFPDSSHEAANKCFRFLLQRLPARRLLVVRFAFVLLLCFDCVSVAVFV